MIYFQSLNMYHMNNMKMLYLIHASMIVMNINKISYMKPLLVVEMSNHSIFRHDNFIGCFSADKIKMSARK